jgi:hypothetical protein
MGQRLITVSAKQVQDLENKKYGDFIKQMISLGAHTLKDGGVGVGDRLESIQGPYKDDEGGMLFVVNFCKLRSGD